MTSCEEVSSVTLFLFIESIKEASQWKLERSNITPLNEVSNPLFTIEPTLSS